MRWLPLVALLALAACTSPTALPELEQRVLAADLEGWDRAGLREPPERCNLDRFVVEFPVDEAAYHRLCPLKSNACQWWRHITPSLRPRVYPVAAIHPRYSGPVVERLAAHELLHALSSCTLRDSDVAHTNLRVWYKNNTPTDSAEDYARELLADND